MKKDTSSTTRKCACGWCGQEGPICIRMEDTWLEKTWYPSPSYQPTFGEGPVTIPAPPMTAFICRSCFAKVFKECSYLDVSCYGG